MIGSDSMSAEEIKNTAEDSTDLQAAAELIVQKEQRRQQRIKSRAKRQQREDRKSVERMHHSIETMKWCLVSICAVWVISFIIGIVILYKVNNKAHEIEGQVAKIRHTLEHPFENAGKNLGGRFDKELREILLPSKPKEDNK